MAKPQRSIGSYLLLRMWVARSGDGEGQNGEEGVHIYVPVIYYSFFFFLVWGPFSLYMDGHHENGMQLCSSAAHGAVLMSA